jgi:hypothetical protein
MAALSLVVFQENACPDSIPGPRPDFPAKMPHRKNAGAFLFPAHVKPL